MKNAEVKIFVCVQAALYLAFETMDIMHIPGSAPVKFSGIVLCFAFSAYLSIRGGDKAVTWAIGFSMLADVLLLLYDGCYAVGIGLFCLAQTAYFLRIYRANGGKGAFPARAIVFAAALMALAALDMAQPLNILAVFYFSFFLCNTVQSFGAKNGLFSLGLCLFICCDVCVGLHNLPITGLVGELADVGMWTFYLPSQVLITLSGRRNDEKAS